MQNIFVILLFFASWISTPAASGQTDEAADQQALKEVEKLLNDPAARREFSKGNTDAQASNAFFEKFPGYAQQELNAIVMLIMNESKAGADKHVQAMKQGGAQGAYDSFSPQVKSRIESLQKRLSADPQFNSPANMELMKKFMPAFLAKPGT